MTFLVSFLRRGIQWVSRTLVIVSVTPPWRVARCARWTSLCVNALPSGRLIGYAPTIRPLHSSIPLLSGCKLSCNLSASKFFKLLPSSWARLVSWYFISSVVRGPFTPLGFRFLELVRNLDTHAHTCKAFNRLCCCISTLNLSSDDRAVAKTSFITGFCGGYGNKVWGPCSRITEPCWSPPPQLFLFCDRFTAASNVGRITLSCYVSPRNVTMLSNLSDTICHELLEVSIPTYPV